MSLSSTTSVNLTDPHEGTYTCKVKWWADASYLTEEQATKTLTYAVPTGETNAMPTWSAQYATFKATLTGGTFQGRQVAEFDGDGFVFDACSYIGSPRDPYIHVTNPWTWITVSSENAYNDELGWATADIDHYRSIPGKTPCKTTLSQTMKINRPGQAPAAFITNSLELTIGLTVVTNKRANISDTKVY